MWFNCVIPKSVNADKVIPLIGNPITFSIILALIIIIIFIIAMITISSDSDMKRIMIITILLLMVIVPLVVGFYEYCRKRKVEAPQKVDAFVVPNLFTGGIMRQQPQPSLENIKSIEQWVGNEPTIEDLLYS